MARHITKSLFGPGSACDNCNRVNWDMGSEGSLCYYCKAGIFMHRSFWRYTFDQHDELIDVSPRPEVTEAEVHEEWRRLALSYAKWPHTMPELLQDMLTVDWLRMKAGDADLDLSHHSSGGSSSFAAGKPCLVRMRSIAAKAHS